MGHVVIQTCYSSHSSTRVAWYTSTDSHGQYIVVQYIVLSKLPQYSGNLIFHQSSQDFFTPEGIWTLNVCDFKIFPAPNGNIAFICSSPPVDTLIITTLNARFPLFCHDKIPGFFQVKKAFLQVLLRAHIPLFQIVLLCTNAIYGEGGGAILVQDC